MAWDLIPRRKRWGIEPFRREINEIRREMDRMFNRFFGEWPSLEPVVEEWAPAVDVSETADNLVVRTEVPGISPDDIKVSLVGNNLIIKGEKKQEKEEKEENYYRMERSYGSFARTIPLPCEIVEDKVEAKYKNGVLTITLPKCEPSKAKEIKIEVKS
jgi:HSP20 family protein